MSSVPESDGGVRPGLAAELMERQKQLELEQAEVEEAKKDLALAKQQLETQIAELKRLTDIRRRQAEAKKQRELTEREARLLQLITTVEKMEPKAAAPYLDRFETPTAAAILHGVKLRKAAEIIANMNASKAAALSRWYLKNGQPLPTRDPK